MIEVGDKVNVPAEVTSVHPDGVKILFSEDQKRALISGLFLVLSFALVFMLQDIKS